MSKPIFKVQTISVYISTTLVLLLLGVMGILFVGGKSLSRSVQENLVVSVIIDSNVEEPDILEFKENLDKKECVQKSVYISKEQALEEEKAVLKTDPTEQLGYNPYEASIEITLTPEYSNTDSLALFEEELLANSKVSEVLYQKNLVDAVNSNIKKAGVVLMIFLVMLTLISWSLIGNLVRLSIYSRRFLLHTMKLVGATWGFIRRPFIISNMWIGLFSGVLADALLAAGIYVLQQKEPSLEAMFPVNELLYVGGFVILFGVAICTLCAFLSVNKFLRMRSNDLYFI